MKNRKVHFLFALVISLSFSLIQSVEAVENTYYATVCPWPGGEYVKVFQEKCKTMGIKVDLKFFTSVPDWIRGCRSGRYHFTLMWLPNAMSLFFDGGDGKEHLAISPVFHDFGSTMILAEKGFTVTNFIKSEKKIGVEFDALVNYGMLYSIFGSQLKSLLEKKRVIQISNQELIINLQRGRLPVITATGNDAMYLKNKGYPVLASSKDYFDYTTGALFIPVQKYRQMDPDFLQKVTKASILAAQDMNRSPYEKLKKIIMKGNSFKNIPIITSIYENEKNFNEHRANVIFYTPEKAKKRASEFPDIFNKIMRLRKNIGNEKSIQYEQVIQFDTFDKEIETLKNN